MHVALSRLRAAAAVIPPPPALLKSVALLAGGPTIRLAPEATTALARAGCAGEALHPATVLRAAHLFGLEPGFAIRRHDTVTAVVTAAHLDRYDRLGRTLAAAARRRGLVPVEEMFAGLPDQVVAAALQATPQLASHDGWFWAVPESSLVARALDRMLTACGPLPLDEVVAGLARATRYAPASTYSAPAGTLLAYLASTPAYRTDGDTACPRRGRRP